MNGVSHMWGQYLKDPGLFQVGDFCGLSIVALNSSLPSSLEGGGGGSDGGGSGRKLWVICCGGTRSIAEVTALMLNTKHSFRHFTT